MPTLIHYAHDVIVSIGITGVLVAGVEAAMCCNDEVQLEAALFDRSRSLLPIANVMMSRELFG